MHPNQGRSPPQIGFPGCSEVFLGFRHFAMDSDLEGSVSSSLEVSERETQFVPQEDDAETLWEVIEITAEKGPAYKVKWAGLDPKTRKPWAQSWVPKRDCTDRLVMEWKRKQTLKKRREARKPGKLSVQVMLVTFKEYNYSSHETSARELEDRRNISRFNSFKGFHRNLLHYHETSTHIECHRPIPSRCCEWKALAWLRYQSCFVNFPSPEEAKVRRGDG